MKKKLLSIALATMLLLSIFAMAGCAKKADTELTLYEGDYSEVTIAHYLVKYLVEDQTDLTVNVKDQMSLTNQFKEATSDDPSCDILLNYDGTLLSRITSYNVCYTKLLRVSLVKNFILEYIMDQFATKDGFTYEIVEIPSFSGRAEALIADQVDAVVFTEPQAGMLVQQGAHLLGSSKEAGIKGGTLIVITSYSIHYTKLYEEPTCALQPLATDQGRGKIIDCTRNS